MRLGRFGQFYPPLEFSWNSFQYCLNLHVVFEKLCLDLLRLVWLIWSGYSLFLEKFGSHLTKQQTEKIITLTLYDGGRYHTEISPLICRANQWTGFYMITASVMKELNYKFY